jgi:pyruvate formate lyase activating enzyme
MRIGGVQKLSLIDYPGRISCVLFLAGCDFACPYCHNPQLTGRPEPAADDAGLRDFLAFLKERRCLLEGVVISGGEPTLHEGLPALCRQIKELGYPLKLDTNGSRPRMLKRLIAERLVDYLAMDIKTEPERYAGCLAPGCRADALRESVRAVMASGIDYEFRTTCVKPLIDPQTIARLARLVSGCRLYALQSFRPGRLLAPDRLSGNAPGFSPAEMAGLQRIAAPHVGCCTLR